MRSSRRQLTGVYPPPRDSSSYSVLLQHCIILELSPTYTSLTTDTRIVPPMDLCGAIEPSTRPLDRPSTISGRPTHDLRHHHHLGPDDKEAAAVAVDGRGGVSGRSSRGGYWIFPSRALQIDQRYGTNARRTLSLLAFFGLPQSSVRADGRLRDIRIAAWLNRRKQNVCLHLCDCQIAEPRSASIELT